MCLCVKYLKNWQYIILIFLSWSLDEWVSPFSLVLLSVCGLKKDYIWVCILQLYLWLTTCSKLFFNSLENGIWGFSRNASLCLLEVAIFDFYFKGSFSTDCLQIKSRINSPSPLFCKKKKVLRNKDSHNCLRLPKQPRYIFCL